MSSWKLTKKLKETHFLRGSHSSSGSSQNSASHSETAQKPASNGSSKASALDGPARSGAASLASSPTTPLSRAPPGTGYDQPSEVTSGYHTAYGNQHRSQPQSLGQAKPARSYNDHEARHMASVDTLVSGSRSNTITESSRKTITSQGPQTSVPSSSHMGSASSAASSNLSGGTGNKPASPNSGVVARNAAGLLRVKIYELRHMVVHSYRAALPSWAFEKSSTKPPPVYIVLEYDKTQILLHAIGGTVEDPVWDKTTAFDVVSGEVPLSMSVYLRTRLPLDTGSKKNSAESERRASITEDVKINALNTQGYHHNLASDNVSEAHSDFQPSSVTSEATSMSTVSTTNSSTTSVSVNKKGADTPNIVKDAEQARIRDVLLDSCRIDITSFNRQEQLNMAGGVLSIKCELHNTRNQSLSIDDFTLMKVIGKGSFGKVMQVRKNDTRQVYALKTIRKAHIVSKSEVGHTLAERTVLAKINNPFIVPLKFSFQSPEKLYLVLAFVNGGELFHHLQREGRFDLNRARFYTAELLCALECLHEYNVIYRDLKPENILIDYTGHISLCDFGLCKLDMGSKDQTSTFCGTPEYLAPELLLGQGYTKSVDWWTLGVLFYEMLTGLPPFYDQNTNTMYHKIVKDPLTFPADMDREAKSLISLLLDRDPARRLGSNGAAEIKAHPFFHQIDWKYLLNKKYAAPFLPSVASAVDTSNFDSEFTSEVPMDSVVDKQFYLSDSVQQQFGGWSYSTESRLASSGKW